MSSMLVGFVSRQIMRHAFSSESAGRTQYRAYFADTDRYQDIKEKVDRILRKCGYEKIICV